ncbi:uncharacterized protein MICPUCDRAFT_50699 [Micromonas pusilla CCMP1545]|jgi:hypothetical protein|uniref:Predicted protein n=2 Tax=Micromonas pusilla TaxID=38833 RepID=C1MIU6_MICPC|nr:uncharacterized protein MICPUCDRAFT_50699 [Micromonas pusilla CCMP1545]EEH60977.1 predicted protein [Micromonas pusilla CCMP1545]|eukprot:XP_003055725.1 predicted protein [Micromonas pusilla CCMP1545]
MRAHAGPRARCAPSARTITPSARAGPRAAATRDRGGGRGDGSTLGAAATRRRGKITIGDVDDAIRARDDASSRGAPERIARDVEAEDDAIGTLRAATRAGVVSVLAAALMSSACPGRALADASEPSTSSSSLASSSSAASSTPPPGDDAASTATAPPPEAAAGPSDAARLPNPPPPLSASAPLPSEVKKQAKAMADDAARDGVAAGGDAGRKESSKEKRANRLEELNVLRVELDTKELELREAAQELLRREQTTAVLTEELELSRRLNDVLSAELNRVREEGKLSVGLCAQGLGLP